MRKCNHLIAKHQRLILRIIVLAMSLLVFLSQISGEAFARIIWSG